MMLSVNTIEAVECQVRVNLRRRNVGVAQDRLYGPKIGAILDHSGDPGTSKKASSPARSESLAAGHVTAEPGYIWDLAATDVFPPAGDPGPRTEAPGAVPGDGDPGAS